MKPLFVIAALLGALYILLWPLHPYPFSYLLKAAPVLMLALIGVKTLTGPVRIAYLVAMLGSAAGDIFLDFDRQLYLRQALASFLLTQMAYIVIFARLRQRHRLSLGALLASTLLPVTAAAILLWQFHPNTWSMWWPVVVYVVCLTSMAVLALQTGQRWLALGGVLFMTADALIGVNRFWLAFDYSTPLIVSVYMTAQMLIGYGLLFSGRSIATRPAMV